MTDQEAQSVKNLLEKYDLPTSYTITDVNSFYEAFFLDKKSADASVTFIIPVGIGGVKIINDIDKELILSVLRKFGAK